MIVVSAAIIERDGRILLTRRKARATFGGCWEFPGGKLEPRESPQCALARELREELGIETHVGRIVDVLHRVDDTREVLVLFFRCEWIGGALQTLDNDGFAFFSPQTDAPSPMVPGDDGVWARLRLPA